MKNAWYKEHLSDGKSSLPFSFTYDGQPSATLLAEWPAKMADERLDANRTRRTLTWTDPATGLEVRCVAVDYADYPAIEWLLHFRNTGATNTPIIAKIQALDCNLSGGGKGFVLHRALGEANSAQSFAPVDEPLPHSDAANAWYGYQFNRPEQTDGVLQAFRRPDCAEASQTCRLRGLDPAAMYEITNFDSEGVAEISGRDLMEKGLTIAIDATPGAAVIIYRLVTHRRR